MPSSSFPSGGGGSPGGSTTQVQYNNAGAFGGAAGTVWNTTNHTLNVTTTVPPVDTTNASLGAALLLDAYTNGSSYGIQSGMEYDGSADITPGFVAGGAFSSGQTGSGKTGTVGVYIRSNYSDSTARVPNNYGVYVESQSGVGAANYGIFLDDQGVTNTAIKTGTGFVTLGGQLITATHTPSSAADTGVAGQFAWDASFIYICTTTNTWKRVAIATW